MKLIFALQIAGSAALAQPHDLQVLIKFLEKGRLPSVEAATGNFQKNIDLDKNTNPEKPSNNQVDPQNKIHPD